MRYLVVLLSGVAGLAAAAVAPTLEPRSPPVPSGGKCKSGWYWDTGRGCQRGPPPSKHCGPKQYDDSAKGCCARPAPSGPPLTCSVVNQLVSAAHQKPQASSFCCAYLHKTVTRTATYYTANTITPTVPVTTVATVSTSTITTCASPAPAAAPARQKRGAGGASPPNCWPTGLPGASITSACGCIGVQPSTKTVTVTASAYSTVTLPAATPSTVTVYTSTTQVASIPTFSVVVSGGDNNGLYFAFDDGDSPVQIENDETTPGLFTIDENNALVVVAGDYTGSYVVEDPDEDTSDPYLTYLSGTGDLTPANQQNVTCLLQPSTDGTCPLICHNAEGDTTSWDCGTYWRLGPEDQVDGCNIFTPYIVN